MRSRSRSLFPGIFLIAAGLWLAFRHNTAAAVIWRNSYPLLICALAVLLLYDAYRSRSGASVFWGTFLLFAGLFYTIVNYDLIHIVYIEEYWPVLIIAAGVSFLICFLVGKKSGFSLFAGVFLVVWGAAAGLDSLFMISWDYAAFVSRYWPVMLIIFGISLIGKSFLPRNQPRI